MDSSKHMYHCNIFGSKDSRDLDIVVSLPESVDGSKLKSHEITKLEVSIAQSIEEDRKSNGLSCLDRPVDVTLITLDSLGHITWTSKGTPTKTNNVVFATYALHEQVHPCLVSGPVARRKSDEFVQLCGAIQRSVTNSYFNSLPRDKTHKFMQRQLMFLRNTVLSISVIRGGVPDQPNKRCKALAFQIAITHSLLIDNVEVFTKSDIFSRHEDLKPLVGAEVPYPENSFVVMNRLLQEIVDWSTVHEAAVRAEKPPAGF
eukprot:TRINITY_DN12141_c0_g1_i1.p1 TRINITY_DN12141_c0_g1~~TRINITY_DN12141_c0_g1_i1.p1  ORF type:complete len:259 (+),score=23.45 TRINITY_DN12141_c0_g1_i1:50-826(+)